MCSQAGSRHDAGTDVLHLLNRIRQLWESDRTERDWWRTQLPDQLVDEPAAGPEHRQHRLLGTCGLWWHEKHKWIKWWNRHLLTILAKCLFSILPNKHCRWYRSDLRGGWMDAKLDVVRSQHFVLMFRGHGSGTYGTDDVTAEMNVLFCCCFTVFVVDVVHGLPLSAASRRSDHPGASRYVSSNPCSSFWFLFLMDPMEWSADPASRGSLCSLCSRDVDVSASPCSATWRWLPCTSSTSAPPQLWRQACEYLHKI